MVALLRGKCALAPDLPQLQRLPVFRLVLPVDVFQPGLPEVAVLQLSRAPFIGLIQAFLSQRAALTVLFIGQIQPVQTASAAVQGISPHEFALWANVGVPLLVIAKSAPLQLRIGSVVDRLWAYKKVDFHVAQIAICHRKIVGSVTSSRGERAYADNFIYGMTKAALTRACQSIAIDLSPYGIRVNCVAPGATWTHEGAAHETLKNGGEMIGNRTRAKVVKNKVAPPFREAEFDIMYGEGISKVGEIIDLGVKLEIIDKAGAWYTCNGQRIQGRDGVREYMLANPDACDAIEKEIRDNAYKLLSPQARKAAQVSGRGTVPAVDVSAADFDEE